MHVHWKGDAALFVLRCQTAWSVVLFEFASSSSMAGPYWLFSISRLLQILAMISKVLLRE